jgi:hypothetical protein
MLGSGFAFLKNAHVRIDFISNHLSAKTRNIIDMVGIVVFLFPLCYMLIVISWPLFVNAWTSGEMSQNAGGLIRWPMYALIPLGFMLLALQGPVRTDQARAFIAGAAPIPLAIETESKDEIGHEIEEHAAHVRRKSADGIHRPELRGRCSRRCRCASSASSRTTPCSRFPSSPSWASSSSAAAWPRICSTPSARCSGRSAAASRSR